MGRKPKERGDSDKKAPSKSRDVREHRKGALGHKEQPDVTDFLDMGNLEELERELCGPKQWFLTGEVDSKQRPEGSLLDHIEEIVIPHRKAAVREAISEFAADGTQGTLTDTNALEEKIASIARRRIWEGLFDNVQRAQLPLDIEDIVAEIDELKTTKSQEGLAEVHAAEKLKTFSTGGKTEIQILEEKVLQAWDSLRRSLDSLVDSAYIPKPLIQPIENPNIKSIRLE